MALCYLVVLAGLLLATQLQLEIVLVGTQNTNFSFPYFNSTDSFLTVGDVMHDVQTSSFTLTPEGAALFQGSCGKLFYKDPVRMKTSPSGADVASFHTAFTFNIYGPNIIGSPYGWQHADGIAFTFCRYSNLNQFNDATGFGGSYCLLNHQNDGMPSNRLFAVEFDIFQDLDVNDISDNHIGININSMKSSWYYNLCGGSLRNCTYLCNGGYFTSWIDYDNATQILEVFLANGSLTTGIPKPSKPLINVSLALDISLGELVDDYMYVGFTAGTGVVGALHQIQSWTFTSSGMPELDIVSHHGRAGTIAGLLSAGAIAALILVGFFFIARYRKQDKFNLADQNQLVPREFTYKELSKATKNFSKSEFLGSGGFGKVYKGTLPSGVLVAVKRLKHGTRDQSFQAEIHSLTQIEPHRNLVQLKGWGWCHEKEQLFLVYDYMSNGSLDEWLFGHSKRRGRNRKQYSSNLNKDDVTLPLNLRYSILRGVATALLYLHEECSQCVLHRDIKSSNVLLDGFWTAHLGDFGLARVITHRRNMGKTEKTTLEGGTLGYMAPEMPIMGRATKESDVYSFGVLMLEVMCGTRPLDIPAGDHGTLVDKVWLAQEGGNILLVADSKLGKFPPSNPNPGLGGESQLQEASRISIHARDAATRDVIERRLITNLLHLGLLCCNPNPEDRPIIGQVSQWLQSAENMETFLPALPKCRPHAHYGEGAHNRV